MDDVREQLEREAARVTDRLRAMALDRLQRPDGEGQALEQRVHAAAQTLADLAADAAGRERRPLPVLATHGVADQLAVTAADVLAEADEPRRREALDVLVALRRTL
ncbi:hypothetical protein [Angustibacter sp. Root456]|uniref:hypothetical protein n=1 Tax=Angustibacter sp. Root456 TaxID=1736539 RepID=UPI000A62ECB7|nr:hypothetical protein [Angustibacter sp. Root456]